jgi:hypothetical protein
LERFEKYKKRYLKRKEKIIIKNYYSKEINNGKSYKAVNFDKIAFVLLLFLSIFILFANITHTIILPIYISLLLVYFITKWLISLRNKRLNMKISKVNDELKNNRIIREISQFNREEFINYVKEILEKYYKSEFIYGEDGIDLIGNIKDKKYAVKCIKSSQEDKIIRKKVLDFYNYINYLDYDEGIIVTNSFFQDGIKEETSLILFDIEGIKEILKGIDEYPSDDEIQSFIIYKYNDRRKIISNQIKIIDIKKIVKLYGVAIILYTISYFVRYSLYYRIVAILSFAVATILGGIKITEYIILRERIPLHKD